MVIIYNLYNKIIDIKLSSLFPCCWQHAEIQRNKNDSHYCTVTYMILTELY